MTDKGGTRRITLHRSRYNANGKIGPWSTWYLCDEYAPHEPYTMFEHEVSASAAAADHASYLTECLQGITHWSACENNAISNPPKGFVCLRCRLEAAEKERDEARASYDSVKATCDTVVTKLLAAQAEAARYREALGRIGYLLAGHHCEPVDIARAALAAEKGEGK